jgi:malic enzyme
MKKPTRKDYQKLSIAAHKKYRGKLSVESTMRITTTDQLSLAYTPGVAGPARLTAMEIEAPEVTVAGVPDTHRALSH